MSALAKDIQGSPEWKADRCGKATGSRIADLTAKTKSGWGASRKNYMSQLIVERLTGQVAESHTNAAMEWGITTEPQARDTYAFLMDVDVVETGSVDHPDIAMTSASPDGLVNDDGLVEIKCPNTATHIDFLLSGKISAGYIKQMQWQMACTDRQWNDFVSFDPRLPDDLQIKIIRVDRDKDMIIDLTGDICRFLSELDDKIEQLNNIRGVA